MADRARVPVDFSRRGRSGTDGSDDPDAPGLRIDGSAVDENLVVQVRSRCVARRAGPSDLRPGSDPLAGSDLEPGEMRVEALDAPPVVDDDCPAESTTPAGEHDGTGGGRVHGRAAACSDVDAGVKMPSPERPARPETGIDRAAHGPSRAKHRQRVCRAVRSHPARGVRGADARRDSGPDSRFAGHHRATGEEERDRDRRPRGPAHRDERYACSHLALSYAGAAIVVPGVCITLFPFACEQRGNHRAPFAHRVMTFLQSCG
jgi:hypothetical protein